MVQLTSDILPDKSHQGQALETLGQEQPVYYTLLDQRYFSGLGNIIKNEAVYRPGIHPISHGSLLRPQQIEILMDHMMEFSTGWLQGKFQGRQNHTQIYQKEQCPAGHQVRKKVFGPIWWVA